MDEKNENDSQEKETENWTGSVRADSPEDQWVTCRNRWWQPSLFSTRRLLAFVAFLALGFTAGFQELKCRRWLEVCGLGRCLRAEWLTSDVWTFCHLLLSIGRISGLQYVEGRVTSRSSLPLCPIVVTAAAICDSGPDERDKWVELLPLFVFYVSRKRGIVKERNKRKEVMKGRTDLAVQIG